MSRVVVVTGASGGVGRAVAAAFGARGDRVALVARGHAGLAAAAKEVEAAGGTALTLPLDVVDAGAVDAAAALVEEELGPIDVWVNNAMVTVFGRFLDVGPDEFERVTRVTYLGQVNGTAAALRRMRPRDRGVIVNVGSALAFRGIPLQSAYCGAKFAVRGFTEAVRSELIADGSRVRITEVHLPAVDTPQFGWCRSKLPGHPQPVAPIYRPEQAAAAIVAAADRPGRHRVFGVWNRAVVIGSKVAPGVLDHFAAATTVDGQIAPDVPPDPADNLELPADDLPGSDRGAHGIFDEQAGGMLDPAMVRTLPSLGFQLARAAVSRALEVLRRSPRHPSFSVRQSAKTGR